MEAPWYQKSIDEVFSELSADPKRGLSSQEAKARLDKYGPNELAQKKGPGILQMFLEQLKDYMVIILLIASVISIFLSEITDSLIIIAIVIINACLGVFQEYRASKALEALKKMSAPNAKVLRDGETLTIPSRELVPGDVVILETGDYMPADLRLISTVNLKVEEAALTGESVPVEKHAGAALEGEVALGDQINSGFMGTVITYGRGLGVVTKTGMNTVIGGIAAMIQEAEEEDTPLQKKLKHMGKLLGTGCLVICALVFVLGLARGEEILQMFMTAISLAVAAIPEGLPAVVTIVLAIGMQRLVKRNAIMKKLHAVETLGGTTVICSDKTGTLTQNQMTIVKMYIPGREISVEGEGYKPFGRMYEGEKLLNLEEEQALRRLLEIQALCNDARLEHLTEGATEEWRIIGDPTEGAMIVAAAKAGIGREEINSKYPRINEIPFDSGRKLMTTFHSTGGKLILACTKGAPDILIERCTKIMRGDGTIEPITDEGKKAVLEENHGLASEALRVLGMAFREVEAVSDSPTSEEYESDLIFCGLVGMIDPPRAEAIEAVKVCKTAGIRVVMITGDYKDTAAAIARQLDIIGENDKVLDGEELNKLSDEDFAEAVKTVNVYARVSPEHKVRIVQAIKKHGNIAAMTGDGVNDAPALKHADIGIAMGITGTDVTKESADMIITDDNFASIVSAVEEGRVIFSNIRKFVFFLMSCNVGEVLIIFISMLLGWPIPLLPIHLLWVNLLTDAFPALALGTEKMEPGLMQQKPRDPKATIIDKSMLVSIIVQSSVMTAAILISFYIGWTAGGEVLGRTYALMTMCISEILRAYTCRSEKHTAFKLGFFSNSRLNLATIGCLFLLVIIVLVPGLRDVFSLAKLSIHDWDWIAGLGILPYVFGELTKVIKNRYRTAKAGV